jgi:hypothetical protein
MDVYYHACPPTHKKDFIEIRMSFLKKLNKIGISFRLQCDLKKISI